MTALRRYTNKIEEFLHSDSGQRFFNIAYSVGAAVVIWGALFKILHLPGGNTLLCIGMGTEIAMFILTAFDRPPKEPNWEEIVPAIRGEAVGGAQPVESLTIVDDRGDVEMTSGTSVGPGHYIGHGVNSGGHGVNGGVVTGGTIVTGGNIVSGGIVTGNLSGVELPDAEDMTHAAEELHKVGDLAEATNRFVEAIEGISQQMGDLQKTLTDGTSGYVDKMADLNRNLAGLNTIYEIQLKSVSGQLDAFEKVNRGLKEMRDMYEKSSADSLKYVEETEKLTKNMQTINEIYSRMIAALTVTQPMAVNSQNSSENS